MKPPIDSQTRYDELLTRLRARENRITPQRLALLRILAESTDHPSASQLYSDIKKRYPTTSLATVYKTIALLKDLNEVLELGFPDGSNRYDGNKPFPHPHVICTRCRKITDPDLVDFNELSEEMSQKTGYRIFSHRLDFFGLCPDCQE